MFVLDLSPLSGKHIQAIPQDYIQFSRLKAELLLFQSTRMILGDQ